MKIKLLFLVVCLAISMGASAQELANFMGQQPVVSPEIVEETVTFRISAPEAKLVRLYGSWMSSPNSSVNMNKDAEGLWTVSIATPSPEL